MAVTVGFSSRLETRSANETADRLARRPEIEIVSCDRCGLYARRIRQGAPASRATLEAALAALADELGQEAEALRPELQAKHRIAGVAEEARILPTLRHKIQSGYRLDSVPGGWPPPTCRVGANAILSAVRCEDAR
jgi:hypothetical protein